MEKPGHENLGPVNDLDMSQFNTQSPELYWARHPKNKKLYRPMITIPKITTLQGSWREGTTITQGEKLMLALQLANTMAEFFFGNKVLEEIQHEDRVGFRPID